MPRTRSLAWSELKVGVMAVAALALTAVLIVAVGGASGFAWERYELKTTFDNVQGLKSGAIVRIAGVEVGKVTKVELSGAGVEVRLSIKKENLARVDRLDEPAGRAADRHLVRLDRHAAEGRRHDPVGQAARAVQRRGGAGQRGD